MEASNVLNHTNFNNPNVSIGTARAPISAGLPSADDPRIIQFGMKYNF